MYRCQLCIGRPARGPRISGAADPGRVPPLHSYSVCRNRMSESDARNGRILVSGAFQPGERLLLHREVGLDVAVGGVGALVAEPQRDHVEGHARLQVGASPWCGARCAGRLSSWQGWAGWQSRVRRQDPGAARRCSVSWRAHRDWAARPLPGPVADWSAATLGSPARSSSTAVPIAVCAPCPADARKRRRRVRHRLRARR